MTLRVIKFLIQNSHRQYVLYKLSSTLIKEISKIVTHGARYLSSLPYIQKSKVFFLHLVWTKSICNNHLDTKSADTSCFHNISFKCNLQQADKGIRLHQFLDKQFVINYYEYLYGLENAANLHKFSLNYTQFIILLIC